MKGGLLPAKDWYLDDLMQYMLNCLRRQLLSQHDIILSLSAVDLSADNVDHVL